MSPTADNVARFPAGRVGAAAPTSLDQVPGEPWELPTPLIDVDRLPTFPLDTMPEPTRSLVQLTAESLDMSDPALVAVLVFPAVATLTMGRFLVRERPGWLEPLQMFLASIGLPSVGKSVAMGKLVGPLHDIERELREAHRLDHAVAESRRKVDEKRRDRLQDRAAKGEASADELRELDDLVQALAVPPPSMPRLITTDATPEKLGALMAENGGRIAQLDDEPGVLGMMAGRFSDKVNLDPWLKGYTGTEPLKVDRMNREAWIDRPTLTLGISVQPAALMAAGRDLSDGGRGIMARILYAWPNLDVWDRSRVAPAVPPHLVDAYAARLRELHAVSCTIDPQSPRVLDIDVDALEVLRSWWAETARMQRELPGGSALREWIGKLDGQTLRMAGNLTLLADPHAATVPLEHATAAVRLARDYFTPQARRVFGELVQDDDHRRALTCLDAIRNAAGRGWERWPHQVKAAEVRQVVRGHVRLELNRAPRVDEALARLVEDNYLRPAPVAAGDEPRGRGKPVKWYEVNPATFGPPADVPAPVVELEAVRAAPRPEDSPEWCEHCQRLHIIDGCPLEDEPEDEPGEPFHPF